MKMFMLIMLSVAENSERGTTMNDRHQRGSVGHHQFAELCSQNNTFNRIHSLDLPHTWGVKNVLNILLVYHMLIMIKNL